MLYITEISAKLRCILHTVTLHAKCVMCGIFHRLIDTFGDIDVQFLLNTHSHLMACGNYWSNYEMFLSEKIAIVKHVKEIRWRH